MHASHAIVITGWGQEDGIKYWKVRNSWGTEHEGVEYPEKGLFRILRGENFCGIESQLCYGSAVEDLPSPHSQPLHNIRQNTELADLNLNTSVSLIAGAWHPQSLTDVTVQNAISHLKQPWLQYPQFHDVSISKVYVQSVAGLNYAIMMEAKDVETGEVYVMKAVVHKSLHNVFTTIYIGHPRRKPIASTAEHLEALNNLTSSNTTRNQSTGTQTPCQQCNTQLKNKTTQLKEVTTQLKEVTTQLKEIKEKLAKKTPVTVPPQPPLSPPPLACTFSAPNHGGMGDCPFSLPHTHTCQPSCDSDYQLSGKASCSAGTLSAAKCNPKDWGRNEQREPRYPHHGKTNKASTAAGSQAVPQGDVEADGKVHVLTWALWLIGAVNAAIITGLLYVLSIQRQRLCSEIPVELEEAQDPRTRAESQTALEIIDRADNPSAATMKVKTSCSPTSTEFRSRSASREGVIMLD